MHTSIFRRYVPPKHRFTYGLHGTISLKMATLITTTVRTSNPKSTFLAAAATMTTTTTKTQKNKNKTTITTTTTSMLSYRGKCCNMLYSIQLNRVINIKQQ
jgi:hypothetical protein